MIVAGKPDGFVAGADIDEFGEVKTEADALALVRRGWGTFNRPAGGRRPGGAALGGARGWWARLCPPVVCVSGGGLV